MDVSPKTVREVEFREKLRGYHPEDVDQFLERVAKGIEILQDRLRAATERAVRAERSAAESAGSDETLRRTLVLAQRTADAAVREAQQQAAQILAEGEARSRQLIADAESRVASMVEEAEGGLRAEVEQLEAARDALMADVHALNQWIDEHRSYLTSALTSAVERLQGDLHLLHDAPAVGAVEVPPRPSVEPAAPPAAAAIPPAAIGEPGPEETGNPEASAGSDSGEQSNGTGPVDLELVEVAARPSEGGEDLFSSARRDGPEEAAAAAQFFAELRDAVDDPQPLGPRDVDLTTGTDIGRRDFVVFDDDDELAGSRRLGSRLRRRR